MQKTDITLVKNAIHNPGELRHFMKAKPVTRRVCVMRGNTILAESMNAVRVLEVGQDLYDPVIYFPKNDVRANLQKCDGSTHCPLKGDAEYFDLVDENEQCLHPRIAWSYPAPFDYASKISGLIAFYTETLLIQETP